MCLQTWDGGGVDVYMRCSAWEIDMWSHYTIDDQTELENWRRVQELEDQLESYRLQLRKERTSRADLEQELSQEKQKVKVEVQERLVYREDT